NSTPAARRRGTFSSLPRRRRLSKAMTVASGQAWRTASASLLPTKPAPPVTRMVFQGPGTRCDPTTPAATSPGTGTEDREPVPLEHGTPFLQQERIGVQRPGRRMDVAAQQRRPRLEIGRAHV